MFSKLLSHRRARVERTFSWLHSHKMLKETSRGKDVVANAFHAVFLADLVEKQMTPPHIKYPTCIPRTDHLSATQSTKWGKRTVEERILWDATRGMLINRTRDAAHEVAKEIMPNPSQRDTAAKKVAFRAKAEAKMNKLVDSLWDELLLELVEDE